MAKKSHELIYGIHAVEAALRNQQENVLQVFVQQGRNDNRIKKLLDIADNSGINVQSISNEKLKEKCPKARHQGVVAEIRLSKSSALSLDDILDKEINGYILDMLAIYNVSNRVIFEIVESEGIENFDKVLEFIKDVKAIGCKIAIDDFGSGYSNFEHLLQLNIDYIKIDGTLIKNLDKDTNAQVVVQTIVDFAKRLDILTVAEFVHNEAVHKEVKNLKIDRTQGFFLAEPQEHTNNT